MTLNWRQHVQQAQRFIQPGMKIIGNPQLPEQILLRVLPVSRMPQCVTMHMVGHVRIYVLLQRNLEQAQGCPFRCLQPR